MFYERFITFKEENQKFVAEEGFDKLVPLITIYMTNSKWNTTPQVNW